MSTRTAQESIRAVAPAWLRRTLRLNAGHAVMHVLLVLATMVACTWLAVPDYNSESTEMQALAAASIPGEPR